MSKSRNASNQEIVALYESGMTTNDVASELHVGTRTVRNAMAESGKAMRSIAKRVKTYCMEPEILRLYDCGLPATAVADQLGIASSTVRRSLIANDVLVEFGRNRQHYFDEHFFDEITTERQAYWLGFLSADGYLSPNYLIGLTLATKDYGHVVQFAEDIGTDKSVRLVDGRAIMNMHSKIMYSALTRLGLHPGKSPTLMPADALLNPKLHRHYWRGAFDGDGSLFKVKSATPGRDNWHISFCGNAAMVHGWREFILRSGIATKQKLRLDKRGAYWFRTHVVVGTCLPYKIARLLYEGSTIYLGRKYGRFMEMGNDMESWYPSGHRNLVYSVPFI